MEVGVLLILLKLIGVRERGLFPDLRGNPCWLKFLYIRPVIPRTFWHFFRDGVLWYDVSVFAVQRRGSALTVRNSEQWNNYCWRASQEGEEWAQDSKAKRRRVNSLLADNSTVYSNHFAKSQGPSKTGPTGPRMARRKFNVEPIPTWFTNF